MLNFINIFFIIYHFLFFKSTHSVHFSMPKNIFNLLNYHLPTFFFFFWCLVKYLGPLLYFEVSVLCFASNIFIISGFTFKSLINFEVFVAYEKYESNYILPSVYVNFCPSPFTAKAAYSLMHILYNIMKILWLEMHE